MFHKQLDYRIIRLRQMIKSIFLWLLVALIVESIFYFSKKKIFWKYLKNRAIYYFICLIVIFIFFE